MVVCTALKRDQRNGRHGDPSISRFPACRDPILVGICQPEMRDFARNSPSKRYTNTIPIPTILRKQSVVLRPDLHPSHKVGCGKRASYKLSAMRNQSRSSESVRSSVAAIARCSGQATAGHRAQSRRPIRNLIPAHFCPGRGQRRCLSRGSVLCGRSDSMCRSPCILVSTPYSFVLSL